MSLDPWILAQVFVALLLVACFQRSLARLWHATVSATDHLLELSIRTSQHVCRWGTSRMTQQMERVDLGLQDRWKWSYAAGALLSAAACVGFVLVDLDPMAKTLSALGFGGGAAPWRLSLGMEWLLALSVVGCALYSWAAWKELSSAEHAHLVPVHLYSPGALKSMRWSAAVTLTLVVGVIAVMGSYRAYAILASEQRAEAALYRVDAPAATEPGPLVPDRSSTELVLSRTSKYASMIGIPLALTVCAGLAFSLGWLLLIKLTPATLLLGLVLTARGAERFLALLRASLAWLAVITRAAGQLLIRFANLCTQWMVLPFRLVYAASVRCLREEERLGLRLLAGFGYAISSWAAIAEVPNPPTLLPLDPSPARVPTPNAVTGVRVGEELTGSTATG